MKAAIFFVFVLALVAATQARSVVQAGVFNGLTKAFPDMSCALEHMRDVINKECTNIFDKSCMEKEESIMSEIVEKCFAKELKHHVKTEGDTRDADVALKFLSCLAKDAFQILTGNFQNQMLIFECLQMI